MTLSHRDNTRIIHKIIPSAHMIVKLSLIVKLFDWFDDLSLLRLNEALMNIWW